MDTQTLLQQLHSYGPLGLFLAAFISNAIPGFPAIYLTIVGTYAVLVHDPRQEALVIISAGVGAGLGKVAVFYASNLLAGKSRRIRRMRDEYMWVLNRGKIGVFILVFLFASLPLPDDVLYIPLGVSGFSLPWFTVGVILGKIVLTAFVYFLGNTYWNLVNKFFGSPENVDWGLVITGLIAGTLILTYIIFAINWKRVYDAYTQKGIIDALKALLDEFIGAITLRPVRRSLARREAQLS